MNASHNVSGIIKLGLVAANKPVSGSFYGLKNLVVDEHTEILARMMASGLTITHIVFEYTNVDPGTLDEATTSDSAEYYDTQPDVNSDFIIAPLISQPLYERISSAASRVTFTATTASAAGTGIYGVPWIDGCYLTHLGLIATESGYGSGRRLFSRSRVGETAISKPTDLDLCAHWQITFEQPA